MCMCMCMYNNRKDTKPLKSVKGTHAELKTNYHDAYTRRCKTAMLEDKDLTPANWRNISKFMSRQVANIKERGNTLRKPGSGRPETELSAVCKKIVEKAALGRGGSAAKARSALAAKGFLISKSKLFQEMRKILDFKFPIKMLRLFPRMMLARMEFADHWTNAANYGTLAVSEDVGINLSIKFLEKVLNWLFTDEKTFFTFGNNTKLPGCWVKKGRQYTVQTCKVSQKSFHVWGGICGHGKTKLHIFEGIMDADKYIQIMEECCLPALRDLNKGKNKNKYMIVEDGDPKHSMHCAKTNDWFCDNGLEYKRVLDNSPPEAQEHYTYQRQKRGQPRGVKETVHCRLYSDQVLKYGLTDSPDLNLIEHIWGWIERRLGEMEPITDLEELKATVGRLWEEAPIDHHRNACKSYEDRLWNVLDQKGGNICGRVSPHNDNIEMCVN